jgi:hypothetical protein
MLQSLQDLLVRTLSVAAFGCLAAVLMADTAAAVTVRWYGTIESKLAAGRRFDAVTGAHTGIRGSGVATVNGSGSPGLINTLRLAGGITGSGFSPVTDPDTSATIRTIGATATMATGTLGDFQSAPLSNNVLTFKGFSRICLLIADCAGPSLDIPYSVNASNKIGIGGLLTAGRFGNVRISIEAGPWTIGTGTAINQTAKGNFKVVTVTPFIHNPASGSSASAATSGVVQLISPMQVTTIGAGDNNDLQSLFSILTLHFVPEPGYLLLLGAGVTGMGLLGRNRFRR